MSYLPATSVRMLSKARELQFAVELPLNPQIEAEEKT